MPTKKTQEQWKTEGTTAKASSFWQKKIPIQKGCISKFPTVLLFEVHPNMHSSYKGRTE